MKVDELIRRKRTGNFRYTSKALCQRTVYGPVNLNFPHFLVSFRLYLLYLCKRMMHTISLTEKSIVWLLCGMKEIFNLPVVLDERRDLANRGSLVSAVCCRWQMWTKNLSSVWLAQSNGEIYIMRRSSVFNDIIWSLIS